MSKDRKPSSRYWLWYLFIALLTTSSPLLAGPPNPVFGIDIATVYQGLLSESDWQQIYNARYRFAYVRGSLGIDPSFRDNQLDAQMQNGVAGGLLMGVYHAAFPHQDSAVSEAAWFVQEAGRFMGPGYLRPVLDIEKPNPDTGAPADYTQWVIDFCDEVERLAQVRPIIYTYSGYADRYLNHNGAISNYPLWIADYGGPEISYYDPSRTPRISSFASWKIWQFLRDHSTKSQGHRNQRSTRGNLRLLHYD